MVNEKSIEEHTTRHRLVGAAVLFALGVIFIPMILKGKGPGTGIKTTNLTEEVKEWISGTEEAKTYVSRVVPVGENARQQAIASDLSEKNLPPELKVIEQSQTKQSDNINQASRSRTTTDSEQQAADDQIQSPAQITGLKAENVDRGWIVQVGIFSKIENAQSLITILNKSGFDPRYEVIDAQAGKATRVWVGPYEKRVTAGRALDKVKEVSAVKGFIKSFP